MIDKKTVNKDKKSRTIVIGHKNPDTDSIASAVGYANFKKLRGLENVSAAAAGFPAERTEYLFKKYNTKLPPVITNVTPQVKDILNRNHEAIHSSHVLLEAMEYLQRNHQYRLPVIDDNNLFGGMISLFDLSAKLFRECHDSDDLGTSFIDRKIKTTIELAGKALKAERLNLERGNNLETLHVYVAAMSLSNFTNHMKKNCPEQLAIVVGNREDIQFMAVNLKIRLLIVTGGYTVNPEILETAKANGTSILQTAFDSATTVKRLKFSTPAKLAVNTKTTIYKAEDKLADIRRAVMSSPEDNFPVTDENNKLIGTFTKFDLDCPSTTKLVLVDHNELNQAVDGAEDVQIVEIMDHHRLGMPMTDTPVKVTNDIIGSTSTLVAEQFKLYEIPLSREIAGILLGGIITDTLLLRSPTTTQRDINILKWLEKVSETNAKELSKEIFNIGSLIATQTSKKVLNTDKKYYDKDHYNFAVAQVEEISFDNFLEKKEKLLAQIKKTQKNERLDLFALLVTNIISENSLLLVAGNQPLINSLPYSRLDDNTFDLPGILSRKKQLLPQLLKIMSLP